MTTKDAPRGAAARLAEDRVLANAAMLDPGDDCIIARQIREAAASIRDYREVTR